MSQGDVCKVDLLQKEHVEVCSGDLELEVKAVEELEVEAFCNRADPVTCSPQNATVTTYCINTT